MVLLVDLAATPLCVCRCVDGVQVSVVGYVDGRVVLCSPSRASHTLAEADILPPSLSEPWPRSASVSSDFASSSANVWSPTRRGDGAMPLSPGSHSTMPLFAEPGKTGGEVENEVSFSC